MLTECRNPPDITDVTGEAAQNALTAWGAALRECRQLNKEKADYIRRTSL